MMTEFQILIACKNQTQLCLDNPRECGIITSLYFSNTEDDNEEETKLIPEFEPLDEYESKLSEHFPISSSDYQGYKALEYGDLDLIMRQLRPMTSDELVERQLLISKVEEIEAAKELERVRQERLRAKLIHDNDCSLFDVEVLEIAYKNAPKAVFKKFSGYYGVYENTECAVLMTNVACDGGFKKALVLTGPRYNRKHLIINQSELQIL